MSVVQPFWIFLHYNLIILDIFQIIQECECNNWKLSFKKNIIRMANNNWWHLKYGQQIINKEIVGIVFVFYCNFSNEQLTVKLNVILAAKFFTDWKIAIGMWWVDSCWRQMHGNSYWKTIYDVESLAHWLCKLRNYVCLSI
jgi:hypothetical protein